LNLLKGSTVTSTSSEAVKEDVTGIVTSAETGEPLIGVSVTAKGTPFGTITDENGKFRILAKKGYILLFTYVGFESYTITVGNATDLKISLKPSQKALDEVVVIGYGTSSKRINTGSVSSITSAEISKQPIANVLAALPGRIPGAQIAQNNGLPGSAVQIQIRGQGSLSSGTIPLYVIDGVPFTNFNGGSPATDNLNAFGTSGANGGVSPFSMINPADIERIDILKDADATSIYGSRGANGVVLITTKRGKSGKTKFDVNASTGFSELNRFIPMLNPEQYYDLRTQAFKTMVLRQQLIMPQIYWFGIKLKQPTGKSFYWVELVKSMIFKQHFRAVMPILVSCLMQVIELKQQFFRAIFQTKDLQVV